MTISLEAFGIDRLSAEDRIVLVQAIWDSIAVMPDRPPLSEPMRQELDRRLAEHLANPHEVIPWEQVEAEALARTRP